MAAQLNILFIRYMAEDIVAEPYLALADYLVMSFRLDVDSQP